MQFLALLFTHALTTNQNGRGIAFRQSLVVSSTNLPPLDDRSLSHQAGLHRLLARLPDEVRRPSVFYAHGRSLALVGALYECHHLVTVSIRVPESKKAAAAAVPGGGGEGRKAMSGGASDRPTRAKTNVNMM